MPIQDRDDAHEVEARISAIFAASSPDQRAAELRRLFVETLDFDPASGQVPLRAAPAGVMLPSAAERIALLDGVNVCYVALDITDVDRVRKAEAAAAAKQVANQLGDDLLLIFTNTSGSQLHFIHPSFEHAQPTLRRMVVERDLPRRTAVQQVASIYWKWRDSGNILTALETAFDVEPVTKRFFRKYREVFEAAEAQVSGFGPDQDEDKRLFVQTLFNRLMFVLFLSRKGWLTFYGEKDYLNALWRAYQSTPEQANFYDERLYHLFFFGLNNPQSRDLNFDDGHMSSVYGVVPFLNGGLFEKSELDQRDDITVPDAAIEPVLRELFDRFNFTVMESTPFDIEVAVDPEMLGKVFEELVTGRHESGAYYTPRPVVSFMCREALKGYLNGRDTELSAEAIERFVDDRETGGITVNAARVVSKALGEITVVDPACGSGAYLLGMLQELVDLQTTLYNVRTDPHSLYDLKLHIIERNLYGVDIDEFAVNIAMLRLWLSLAIEGDRPASLPNLDFKIVCGDSLLGPDPNPELQGDLFTEQIRVSGLGSLKADYMRASDGNVKSAKKREIEAIHAQLRETLGGVAVADGVVDWRIEFADVLATGGGFNIAIANPPYVRHEEIGDSKPKLRSLYSDSTAARSDLYCYFYARALQTLTSGGMHVFVCSNSWLDARYGARLQESMLCTARILAIYESAIERQFSTAAINTIISVIQKTRGDDSFTTRFVSFRGAFDAAIQDAGLRRQVLVSRIDLEGGLFDTSSGNDTRRLVGGKWGGKYLRAPEVYTEFMNGISTHGARLSDYVRGERYLNTGGADGFFVLTDVVPDQSGLMKATVRSKEGRAHGNPEFLIEKEFLRPGYRRTDSGSLRIDVPDCYVLVIPPDFDILQYRVSKYIAWAENVGFNERSVTRTQSPWWRPPLQARSGALVLWPRTHSRSHRCFYNPQRIVSLRFFRLHPILDDLTIAILAVLNSTLFALLKEIHGRRGLGHGALETGLVDIMPLPFPELDADNVERLKAGIRPLLTRSVGDVRSEIRNSDRVNLDTIVLQAYGVDVDLLNAIYQSTNELIDERRVKARSIS